MKHLFSLAYIVILKEILSGKCLFSGIAKKNWRHTKSDKRPQLHTVFLIRNHEPKTACPPSQCTRYGRSNGGPPSRQLDAVVTLLCYFWRSPSGVVVPIAKRLVWPDRSKAVLWAKPPNQQYFGKMQCSLFHRDAFFFFFLQRATKPDLCSHNSQCCSEITSYISAHAIQYVQTYISVT